MSDPCPQCGSVESVRVAEADGAALAAAMRRLAAELALTDVQVGVWRQAVPKMLRQLAAREIEGGVVG